MPLIIYRRPFIIGLILLISFFATLSVILSPVFNGRTGIQAADDLFNSLSKGSSYYIPDVIKEAKKYKGTSFEATIKTGTAEELDKTKTLFEKAGAQINTEGGKLVVKGDLGVVAERAALDADLVFKVQKGDVSRYSFLGKEAVFYWWSAFKQIEKSYLEEGKTKEAMFVKKKLAARVLEPAYNYSGIPPAKVSENAGITTGLLLFYLIYTVWYGFAVMLIFEGMGITASSHGKAEV